jgi:hypothetical protein
MKSRISRNALHAFDEKEGRSPQPGAWRDARQHHQESADAAQHESQ